MKTLVISKDKTIIEVRHKRQNESIIVDNDTLLDWFPFNSLYSYVLDKDGETMILKRGRGLNNISYGITDSKSELVNNPKYQCKVGKWVNPAVRRDNKKMIADAKEWGIPTIDEPFDMNTVNTGMKMLGDRLAELSNSVINYYLSDKDDADKLSFLVKERDSQLNIALTDYKGYIAQKYCRIGEIYVMLKLMKKMARFHKKVD